MPHWWTSTTPGYSPIEEVSLADFRTLVAEAPPNRDMREVILHHTWEPTVAQYAWRQTWEGIQRYHVETKGWSDIGYHAGVGPDGSLWLLRPIQRSGAHCIDHNAHSIGVAMIGNFDQGHDDPGLSLMTAVEMMGELCRRFALTDQDVWFHADFADKTCPGTSIDRHVVRLGVKAILDDAPPAPPPPHWAQADLDWAVENDIMDGTRPDDAATRAEVVTMLRRATED